MNNQLVVSRFNEDLDWLKKWKDEFEIIVYNKGEKIDALDYLYIELPNYGRESHTYLYHIVNNYHNLHDNTVFIQGDISNIGVNVHKNLMQYIVDIEKYGFSANNIGFFNENIWNNINFIDNPKYKNEIETGFLKLSKKSFKEYVIEHLGKLPKLTPVSWCGCFGVSKEYIHSRPKKFYEKLLKSIPEYHTPEESHFIERMWAYIFTENKWRY